MTFEHNGRYYCEGAFSYPISAMSDREICDLVVCADTTEDRDRIVEIAAGLGRRMPPDLAGRAQRYSTQKR